MKARWYVLLLVVGSAALGAEPDIEFAGVIGGNRDLRVALTNKSTKRTEWVMVGKEFAGYTVSAYDPKEDVVVLIKDGQQFKIHLKEGKVQRGAAEPQPEIKKAILNNLRMLAAASDQFYLENGKNRASYDDLVGPTKYIKSLEAKDGENYRALQFEQGKPIVVTTTGGFTISYAP